MFSQNIEESKFILAKTNPPYWVQFLDDAQQYYDIHTEQSQNVSVDDVYVVNESYYGIVSNTPADAWWDLFDYGTLRTESSTVLPSTIHSSLSGTVSIVSDSGNDDSGGTGMQSVFIYGFDANTGELNAELVVLDGTNPVSTAKNYSVYRLYPGAVGSNLRNVGNITATGGTNLGAFMGASEGFSNNSMVFIPSGYQLNIKRLRAKGQEAGCRLRWGAFGPNNKILGGDGILLPAALTFEDMPLAETSFFGPGVFFVQGKSVTSASQLFYSEINVELIKL